MLGLGRLKTWWKLRKIKTSPKTRQRLAEHYRNLFPIHKHNCVELLFDSSGKVFSVQSIPDRPDVRKRKQDRIKKHLAETELLAKEADLEIERAAKNKECFILDKDRKPTVIISLDSQPCGIRQCRSVPVNEVN